jgi:hypothetical protein
MLRESEEAEASPSCLSAIVLMGGGDFSRPLNISGREKQKDEMMKKICIPILIPLALVYLVLGLADPRWASSFDPKTFTFPELPGWKQSGDIQTFSPKDLYEYIDGAADLYLSYDFQELKVAEYQNEKKASVTIEVYRHKTPLHAFGIYSQERLSDANFLDIGAQGYSETDALNFVSGNYYVKMSSFKTGPEDQEVLPTLAKKVAENLGEKGSLPSVLSVFPKEGKRENSEKFVSIKFLGYSFLYSAFTADYDLSGKKFKLFVIQGTDQKECRAMIEKYLQQTGKPEKNIVEGRYTIADPYHGEIDLDWKGKNIGGILNLNDASLRSKYLKLLQGGLEKKK